MAGNGSGRRSWEGRKGLEREARDHGLTMNFVISADF